MKRILRSLLLATLPFDGASFGVHRAVGVTRSRSDLIAPIMASSTAIANNDRRDITGAATGSQLTGTVVGTYIDT